MLHYHVLGTCAAPFSTTAGLPISQTLWLCHNFCSRGPISNLRPVLDSSAKTKRGVVFGFFVKPQNMLVWLVAVFWCFWGVLGTKSTLEPKIDFHWVGTIVWYAHYVHKSSSCRLVFDNFLIRRCFILAITTWLLVRANIRLSSVRTPAWLR